MLLPGKRSIKKSSQGPEMALQAFERRLWDPEHVGCISLLQGTRPGRGCSLHNAVLWDQTLLARLAYMPRHPFLQGSRRFRCYLELLQLKFKVVG
jgi:hypothetical protein